MDDSLATQGNNSHPLEYAVPQVGQAQHGQDPCNPVHSSGRLPMFPSSPVNTCLNCIF